MNKKLLVLIAMMLASASSAATGKTDIEYAIGSFARLQLSLFKYFVSLHLNFKTRPQPLLHSTKKCWTALTLPLKMKILMLLSKKIYSPLEISNMKMKMKIRHLEMAYDVIYVLIMTGDKVGGDQAGGDRAEDLAMGIRG